jgi:hypothetical protein
MITRERGGLPPCLFSASLLEKTGGEKPARKCYILDDFDASLLGHYYIEIFTGIMYNIFYLQTLKFKL